jgi:hypothetical protein
LVRFAFLIFGGTTMVDGSFLTGENLILESGGGLRQVIRRYYGCETSQTR